MRRLNQRVVALAAAMLLPLAAEAPMAQGLRPAAADATQARVIVKYRVDSEMLKKQAMTATGRRKLQAQALGERIGFTLSAGAGISDRAHVVTAAGLSSASLAARLSGQPDIEYAVVDERRHVVAAPNDTFYAGRPVTATSGGPAVGQWYLKPPGLDGTAANTAPAAINAQQAWDITNGSASIVVAVLDTGVRKDHPDLLGGNVLGGYDMVASDSAGVFVTANDGNGRDADPSDPGDWVTQAEINASSSGDPLFGCEASGSSWHGTQTLGLVGATTGNSAGIASVGRNVSVLPVRVLGKCGGYDSDILVGMQWAANVYSASQLANLGLPANASPAKVISMSLGSTGSCTQPYRDALALISAANVIVVASAGNSAGHAVSTPANCPGIIAVGGLRHVGDKVGFSDLGPQIAVSAPGGNCVNITANTPCLYPIMTTSNAGTTTPVAGAAGATYTDSFDAPSLGTSFAAPLVAGTAALMLSVKPSLTPTEVRSLLQSTARAFPTTGGSAGTPQCTAPTGVDQLECYCTTATCGAGMLDAHAAVIAAIGVLARISVTTAVPLAGQPVTITSSSVIGAGQSATYLWTIVSAGTTGATITGANNADTVTVTPTAAGVFTIGLTTTDNNGFVSSASTVVTVAAVTPPVPPAAGGGGGGGGGGGALGVGWLLLLLSAVLALAAVARLERRRVVSAPARAGRRR
ncbi:MAG: S8 family serine peptidase [Caldimonas sp.]